MFPNIITPESTNITSNKPILINCCMPNDLSFTLPLNLPQAIILPANETEPITKPYTRVNKCPAAIVDKSSSAKCLNSMIEISMAQAPPIPLNKLTISGMAVI